MSQRTTSQQIFSFEGNVGAAPELRRFEERTKTLIVEDPETRRLSVEEVTEPALDFRTFSVAFQRNYDDDRPVWVRCFDQNCLGVELDKGTRVEIEGYLRERSYTDKATRERVTYDELFVTGVEPILRTERE